MKHQYGSRRSQGEASMTFFGAEFCSTFKKEQNQVRCALEACGEWRCSAIKRCRRKITVIKLASSQAVLPTKVSAGAPHPCHSNSFSIPSFLIISKIIKKGTHADKKNKKKNRAMVQNKGRNRRKPKSTPSCLRVVVVFPFSHIIVAGLQSHKRGGKESHCSAPKNPGA